jgi:hypothetical protein
MRVLLAREDIDELGRLIVEARPTVRFTCSARETTVVSTMPRDPGILVQIRDAVVSPSVGGPNPALAWNPEGCMVLLHVCAIRENVMQVGEIGTRFNPANPDHVAFVETVLRVATRLTKPHVTYLDGTKVPIRVGPAAEAWWCAEDEHLFGEGWYRYRLAKPCPAKTVPAATPDE